MDKARSASGLPSPQGGSVSANLDEELRFRILRLLAAEPTLSQREIARELGLSLGKTNYCLRALIDRGWITVRNFRGSQNKLAYAYRLTPSGLHEKAKAALRFLDRKQREYAQLADEIERLRREVGGTR